MSNIPLWYQYFSTSNRLAQTYINGFLDTSGGLISRNGNFALTNGDASLNGRLYVANDALFNRNLYVANDALFNRNLYVANDASLNGRLYVANDTSMNGRLFVGRDASFNGNVAILGNLLVYNQSNVNIVNTMTTNVFTISEDVSLNGNIVIAGTVTATSFNATSDYRIKKEVAPLNASFSVDNLNPISYINTRLNKPDIGFLAHEVQKEYPYLVHGEKDGEELQTLNYIGLIGVLVKEVKLLKLQVSELQNK